MRLNRKASLEIGVNTIVILVIAMVLLGLGVGFIKGLFAKAGGTIDIIDPSGLQNPPTASDPIRISPGNFNMKQGGSQSVVVGIYNKVVSTQKVVLNISACNRDGNIVPGAELPVFQAISGEIPSGEGRGFKVMIRGLNSSSGGDITPGSWLCSIQATGVNLATPPVPGLSLSSEFVMEVTT
jgi:hypothetical protein